MEQRKNKNCGILAKGYTQEKINSKLEHSVLDTKNQRYDMYINI